MLLQPEREAQWWAQPHEMPVQYHCVSCVQHLRLMSEPSAAALAYADGVLQAAPHPRHVLVQYCTHTASSCGLHTFTMSCKSTVGILS